MDNDKTRYMFHVETQGYKDHVDYTETPDIILTQYATFSDGTRWPDVMRSFARFLSNVYGYDVEEQFVKGFEDPMTKWEKEDQ
jgi:hypothetical protein